MRRKLPARISVRVIFFLYTLMSRILCLKSFVWVRDGNGDDDAESEESNPKLLLPNHAVLKNFVFFCLLTEINAEGGKGRRNFMKNL